LGIVSFGGPPVHYQIFYRRFVKTSDERMRWADEKMVRNNNKSPPHLPCTCRLEKKIVVSESGVF
jgi:hypothetical protein